MACKEPLLARRLQDGSITFDHRTDSELIQLACGQCAGCKLERSRQWSVRIMHEARLYEANSFVTLTYKPEHLPENNNLVYRDFQLFMKRLRQAVTRENRGMGRSPISAQSETIKFSHKLQPSPSLQAQLRFYMVGEYGEGRERPHFHAIIFNLDFLDKLPWKQSGGEHKLYRSPTLEKLWTKGYSSIGAVTSESAAYVARYTINKQTKNSNIYNKTNPDTGEIISRKAEFNNMSRRPGIGKAWIKKYTKDVYPDGKVVTNGRLQKAPRYYDQHFKTLDPERYEELQAKRNKEAKANYQDNTPERRLVKDEVTRAQLGQLKRHLN